MTVEVFAGLELALGARFPDLVLTASNFDVVRAGEKIGEIRYVSDRQRWAWWGKHGWSMTDDVSTAVAQLVEQHDHPERYG